MRVTRFCHATRVFASVDPRKAVDLWKGGCLYRLLLCSVELRLLLMAQLNDLDY